MAAESSELQSISERLEKLERQNRWLKRAGAAALLLAAALAVMGQARPSRTITANKFVLLDSEGRQRMTIGSTGVSDAPVRLRPGVPVIKLIDDRGRVRAFLTTDGIHFSDENGRGVVSLIAAENGAGLEFEGKQTQKIGKVVFPVTRMSQTTWGLEFDDSDGTPAISLGGVNPAEAPDTATRDLSFFDAKGKQRVTLGIEKSPVGPHLSFNSQDGKPRAWMWAVGGSPQLGVEDAEGFQTIIGSTSLVTLTTGETQRTSAASVVLLGKDGKLLWSAPPR